MVWKYVQVNEIHEHVRRRLYEEEENKDMAAQWMLLTFRYELLRNWLMNVDVEYWILKNLLISKHSDIVGFVIAEYSKRESKICILECQ